VSEAGAGRTRLDRAGLFHLGVVYVVWGSTYLAIRLAVRDGEGFPPFHLALYRVAAAAAILLGWSALRRHRLLPTRSEAVVLAGSGLLMWVGGNGLVTWAEQRADSGLAALLVAVMPIWGALIGAVLARRLPKPKVVGSLLIGFAGVGLLSWPLLRDGARGDLLSVGALLLAPFTWALGSFWITRRRPGLSIQAASGWQQLFGGLGFVLIIALSGEPRPAPTAGAWAAWAYMTLFGSVIAFTSYVNVLRRLPIRIAMTYAYANPVIAVFLGWLVLRESVTGWTLAGAALVLAGIAGVFNNRDDDD
jgi:drug/metabolite transporter (DMT)-like permease